MNYVELNNERYTGDKTAGKVKKYNTLRVEHIKRMVGTGKKVLDVGCGGGQIAKLLKDLGNKVYGIDISDACVLHTNKRGIKAKKCDLENEDIPFRLKFDVIIAPEIIEHVYDTDAFLNKLRKVMTKDGEIIITTPNVATLGRRLMLLFGINPHLEYSAEVTSAGHIRYFTKKDLFILLKRNGFKPVEFVSDEVNLIPSGLVKSYWLAKYVPTLGRSLIVRAVRSTF